MTMSIVYVFMLFHLNNGRLINQKYLQIVQISDIFVLYYICVVASQQQQFFIFSLLYTFLFLNLNKNRFQLDLLSILMEDINFAEQKQRRQSQDFMVLSSEEQRSRGLDLLDKIQSPLPKRLKSFLVFILIVIALLIIYVYRLDVNLRELIASNQQKLNYLDQNLTKEIQSLNFEFNDFQNKFAKVKDQLTSELSELKFSEKQSPVLPRILWIYTEYNFTNWKMLQQLLGNFAFQKAKQSNFQVRFVNAWTAYDFLSKNITEKITKTMQNRKYEELVSEVLRLALLLENGGIMLRLSECLMIENFDFISNYLRTQENKKLNIYREVLLFGQHTQKESKLTYQDYFIAAVPHSKLISDAFQNLCQIIITGDLKFKEIKKAILINQQTQSKYVPQIGHYLLHSLFDTYSPAWYHTHVIPVDITKFKTSQCRQKIVELLKSNKYQYITRCGQPPHILHLPTGDIRSRIQDELENELISNSMTADKKGYWYAWMSIKANSKLYEPLPPRIPNFCLIDAQPSNDQKSILSSFERLKEQTYKNYSAVYFVNKLTEQLQQLAKNQLKKGFNLTLVPHTGSFGRNLELGITKNCPNKSVIFILRRSQSLADPQTLKNLAQEVAPHGVLGAFIGLKYNQKTLFTKSAYTNYTKLQYNTKTPKVDDLQIIINHLRVFHSDCYKIIPQFGLCHKNGVYFNNRINFLQNFLYMVKNITEKHDYTQIPHNQRVKWYMKQNNHIFDVPNRIALPKNVVINTNAWDKLDLQENKYHYYENYISSMTVDMDHLVQQGIPMQQFAVFNPGQQYIPYTKRNKSAIIPKIFHIVWVDGNLPISHRKIWQLNMQKYPDFQFKIWSIHNISKKTFPFSYDLLITLYNMQPTSRFSRLSTMADVMRKQLLYHQGGIYMDTSLYLFNQDLYKMLSYKFFVCTLVNFRHRWSQGMGIIGSIPKFWPLQRAIFHNNTNHYNIYLRDALDLAGPNDGRWYIRGMEQYDPDILILSFDVFYPMTYDLEDYQQSYCFIQRELLPPGEEIYYEQQGRVLPKNCGKFYLPYCLGKEINFLGSSWQNPRW